MSGSGGSLGAVKVEGRGQGFCFNPAHRLRHLAQRRRDNPGSARDPPPQKRDPPGVVVFCPVITVLGN